MRDARLHLGDGGPLAVWTVGHSNLAPDALVSLLQAAGVTVVFDVRSQPWSRHQPAFGHAGLERLLRPAGIAYRFEGDRLGGRPPEPGCYDADGHVRYDRLAALRRVSEGLAEVVATAVAGERVALLCAEGDPTGCHRRLLLGRILCDRLGVVLHHVLRDGAVVVESSVALPREGETLFDPPWRSVHPVPRPDQAPRRSNR